MAIRPVDLPLLRDEVRADVREWGPATFAAAIKAGRQDCRPLLPDHEAAELLASDEMNRLESADLYFVSSPMVQLARVAAEAMPELTVMPEDLPSEHGFIFFQEPIGTVDYGEEMGLTQRSPIVGASWGIWHDAPAQWPHGGIWVTWYADRDAMVRASGMTASQERLVRGRRSRLIQDNGSQIPFYPEPLPVSTSDGVQSYREAIEDGRSLLEWVGILKTVWVLMGQTVASVEAAKYDRAARRRIQQKGKEPPPVRVISLRRPVGASAEGESDREYHHQWIVKGHWRQQYYPSRGVHRPVWIAPHIKGPEGAPMLGGEKVYAWTR